MDSSGTPLQPGSNDISTAILQPKNPMEVSLFHGNTVICQCIHMTQFYILVTCQQVTWMFDSEKKRCDTMLICLSSGDAKEGCIQMNKVAHDNILPSDDFIEGLSGNIFNVYLEPCFLKGTWFFSLSIMILTSWSLVAYQPVCKGNTFLVHGGMQTVEFKVIKTAPSEFCIVAQDTIIYTGMYSTCIPFH